MGQNRGFLNHSFRHPSDLNSITGAGEMAQQVRVLTALVEGTRAWLPALRTHMAAHEHL